MAIYHLSAKIVSRSKGRSAVASAAYRCAVRLTNERDGITHDYTRKEGVLHAEIVLPEGVKADWVQDRSTLWNAAEFAEKRKDARVAREFEIALPHELTAEQRLEATREMAQDLANRYGAAVDFAIHAPHEASDVRNHHAHILVTTRQVTEEGLGEKTYLERENKWLLANDLPTTDMQLRDIRQRWEGIANERLAMAGLDIRIDHRSHLERGLELTPTEHMGVHATQMQRMGMAVDRGRLDEDAARRNAELIREKPEQVLTLITNEKSVFDRHDIARTLHRYINDDVQAFQNAFAAVMASPALVELQAERIDQATGEVELARYSTREMVEIESGMIRSAERMHQARGHGVDRRLVERAIAAQDAAIQRSTGDMTARLSDEQRRAIEHITGAERISAVVGFAGAGKSTMLAAAREAWEAEGYTVHGAALSGKAAEGLEESSGIQSRTLASWSRSWDNEKRQLGRGDVFVIDEAGMVGSRQLARFIGETEARGVKIVLVGDHEQLQAIGAGAPFRAIAEEIGHAELSEIRRQRVDWQREASVAFATHRTAEGLAAYHAHGHISFAESSADARGEIVRDYLADRDQRPDGTRVAMAHRRVDVRAINEAIRSELQDSHRLGRGEEGGELTFQTNDGKRSFAPGDRIVFLENNRDLGVKNGMLGTVQSVEPHAIQVQLDGNARGTDGPRVVDVPVNDYQAIDHGYATTIHKNQGATVDRAYVLASGTMDRHLTYVAMTRHRDGAQLYAAQDEFADRNAGQMLAPGVLVEHGVAPYEHRAGNSQSYFVTLENAEGERHTTWGVDLVRAIAEAKPAIGDKIGLQHMGSEPVRLPDGSTVERHAWKVQDAGALAYSQLEQRLSRSGVKETTLDYTRDFAERRGIAEQMGLASEIDLAPAQKLSQDVTSRLAHPGQEQQDRPFERRRVYEERADDLAGPVRGRAGPRRQESYSREAVESLRLDQPQPSPEHTVASPGHEQAEKRPQRAEPQKRSMFAGLKLNAGPGAAQERDRASQAERPGRGESLRPTPAQDRLAERVRPLSGFEQAVDHYARAFSAADKQVRQDLPILETQKQELRAASERLDQARPGSHELMKSALQYDPKTVTAITELSGRERVGALVAGMDRERAALSDPNVRSDRFIQRWQELEAERRTLTTGWHIEARAKVESQMKGLTKSLERDPQLASVLRNRSQELGIGQLRQGQNIAREMERQLTRSRSQSLGLSR
ncbi:Ti-type conjugative transfer relaxase TraA [Sinorhizobium meliloti]|uniref:Ti-type conjugative transfer relaxase TraA n=1 Tax=Rhizobium meliloti TaxID=382 RepID=UPI000EFB2A5F|nr:Ti-type conjugative transfer relaxase TraA [Sinorhizobium meliloti]RMC62524.1 Ti-type conjugative transfer relaxase TraA [Sinorhizobium meliloti]